MPYKSKAQRRWMYWAEKHNKVPKGTAKKWEEHTPKDEELQEKVMEKKAFEAGFEKQAFWGSIVGAAAKAGKGMMGMGKGMAASGLEKAINPAMGTLGQTVGKAGYYAGNAMRRTGQWVAKNPQAAAGIGAGVAGTAAVGVGASMLGGGNNKQASAFEEGFQKKAGPIARGIRRLAGNPYLAHGAELAGLGILAAPAASNMAKGEGTWKDTAEVGGLGVLAVPSALHFAHSMMRH